MCTGLNRDPRSIYTDTKIATEWYTIERILRKRVREEQVEYLIKWKGYEFDQSSWEPAANIPANEIENWETVKRVNQPRWDRTGQAPQNADTKRSPSKADEWSDDDQEEAPAVAFSNSKFAEALGLQKSASLATVKGRKAVLSASQSSVKRASQQLPTPGSSESDMEPSAVSQNKLRYSSVAMYRSPLPKADDEEQQQYNRTEQVEQLRAMSTLMDQDYSNGAGDNLFAANKPINKSTSLPIPQNWGPGIAALGPTETPMTRKSKSLTEDSLNMLNMPLSVSANDRATAKHASSQLASSQPLQKSSKQKQKQKQKQSQQSKQPPRSPYRSQIVQSSQSQTFRSPFSGSGALASSSAGSSASQIRSSPVRNTGSVNKISQARPSPFRDRAGASGSSPYQKSAGAFPSPSRGLSFGGFGVGGGSAAKRKAMASNGSANKRAKARAYSVGSDDEDDATKALFTRVKASPVVRLKKESSVPQAEAMTERQKEVLEEQQLSRTLF
jgi:hypothetical protein